MSETAVAEAHGPPAQPVMRWRDAVTPASRASRRRWAALYPLLLTGAGVVVAAPDLLGLGEDSGVGVGFLVAMAVVFGMLRRGTRRLAAVDHPELDERDALARAGAFRAAYPMLLIVLTLSLVALFVVLPDIDRIIRYGPGSTGIDSGLFLTAEAVIGLLLWGLLWAVFLPTGVLAWREPDALDHETVTSTRGVSEPVRDALLATALAVGLGASLAADSSFWALLALLLALMGLGALARRTVGQPAADPEAAAIRGAAFLILGAAMTVLVLDGGTLEGWLITLLLLATGLTLVGLALKGRLTRAPRMNGE